MRKLIAWFKSLRPERHEVYWDSELFNRTVDRFNEEDRRC